MRSPQHPVFPAGAGERGFLDIGTSVCGREQAESHQQWTSHTDRPSRAEKSTGSPGQTMQGLVG